MSGSTDGRSNLTSFAASLERLGQLLSQRMGQSELPFKPGCSEADIDQLEAQFGVELIPEYRSLLRCRDGQTNQWDIRFPPDDLTFLPHDQVLELWREFCELEEPLGRAEKNDIVRNVLYHPKRIPIAYNEMATCYLALDYIPGPRGRIGQLVFNVNEADCVVLEESLVALVARYEGWLRKDVATITEGADDRAGRSFVADGNHLDFPTYRRLQMGED